MSDIVAEKTSTSPTLLNLLTPAERKVAILLVEGHSDTVLANRLGVTLNTARDHIKKIYQKFHMNNRVKVAIAIDRELRNAQSN